MTIKASLSLYRPKCICICWLNRRLYSVTFMLHVCWFLDTFLLLFQRINEGCKQFNHFNVNSTPWMHSAKMPSFVFWIVSTVPLMPTQILSSSYFWAMLFVLFILFCIDSTLWLVFIINFFNKLFCIVVLLALNGQIVHFQL